MYIIILKNTEKNLDFFDKIKVSIFKIHFYSQKSGLSIIYSYMYLNTTKKRGSSKTFLLPLVFSLKINFLAIKSASLTISQSKSIK